MVLGEWLCGSSRGSPACALPLQLNQNLTDVLVSLEKQHGSNTFTVKAQPRCVFSPAGGGAVGKAGAGLLPWSPGLGLPGEGTANPVLPWGGALAGQSAHHLSLAHILICGAGGRGCACGAGGRGLPPKCGASGK